jgi:hypothetical protein
MHTAMLVNLIDSSVMDFNGDGLHDLVPELLNQLPALLRSPKREDFDLILKAARVVAFSPSAEPIEPITKLLLDVACD